MAAGRGGEGEAGFRRALEEADREMDALLSDIHRTSADIFQVEMEDRGSGGLLSPDIRFSFAFKHTAATFLTVRSFILSLLPGFISHPFILRGLKEDAAELVDKHCGRAREDLTRRIRESRREQEARLAARIDTVVEAIEDAVRRARETRERSAAEAEERLRLLEEARRDLEEAARRLGT